MKALLDQLVSSGVLDAPSADWARAHHAQHGIALDTALLELDLIDEESLVRGLGQCLGLAPGLPTELAQVDPGVGQRLPEALGQSFQVCPIRFAHGRLVALVDSVPPMEAQEELRDLFGLQLRLLAAPSHYIAVAKSEVYGSALSERGQRLEMRLQRRREAPDVAQTVEAISAAQKLPEGALAVLQYAAPRFHSCCFMVVGDHGLRIVAIPHEPDPKPLMVDHPAVTSTLAPAIRYGGYFLGPLPATDDNRVFLGSLGQDLARWAFVGRVPVPRGAGVVLFAENGRRGIPTRWAAELSLLAARLGQRGGSWASLSRNPGLLMAAVAPSAPEPNEEKAPSPLVSEAARAFAAELAAEVVGLEVAGDGTSTDQDAPTTDTTETISEPPIANEATPPPPNSEAASAEPPNTVDEALEPLAPTPGPAPVEVAEPVTAASPEPETTRSPGVNVADAVSEAERKVLERLHRAARAAGVSLTEFTDRLLDAPAPVPVPAPPPAPALAGDFKDLFEKLATDIPTQLARGMEAAFKDIAPRLAAGVAPAAAPVGAPAPRPSAAASVDIVVKQAGPREVASYRSRRQKSKRVKL